MFAGVIHYGVFCTRTVIAKGTKFGPFKGRIINTSEIKTNDDNSLMWEVRYIFSLSGAPRAQQVKRWPADLVVPGPRIAVSQNLSNRKRRSSAHSFLLSLTHRPDITETLLKMT